jgi:hypothetical protein
LTSFVVSSKIQLYNMVPSAKSLGSIYPRCMQPPDGIKYFIRQFWFCINRLCILFERLENLLLIFDPISMHYFALHQLCEKPQSSSTAPEILWSESLPSDKLLKHNTRKIIDKDCNRISVSFLGYFACYQNVKVHTICEITITNSSNPSLFVY